MTGGKSYTRPAPKYVESGLLNGRFPTFLSGLRTWCLFADYNEGART